MADRLVSIFGTEKDKVNCPFYFKIGACRHGDKCSRRHNKPALSQTIILRNLYQKPVDPLAQLMGTQPIDPANQPNEKQQQQHYEDFYEDIFSELSAHGEVEEMHVMENLGDHLNGSVYVKFYTEDDAAKAMTALQGRFYAGRPIIAEYSPVTDFRESRCRQYDQRMCDRGGFCNFMHIRPTPRDLLRMLFKEQSKKYKHRSPKKSSSRSPSPRRSRSRSRSRERKDRERERERSDRDRSERDRSDRGRDRPSDRPSDRGERSERSDRPPSDRPSDRDRSSDRPSDRDRGRDRSERSDRPPSDRPSDRDRSSDRPPSDRPSDRPPSDNRGRGGGERGRREPGSGANSVPVGGIPRIPLPPQ